MRGRTAEKQSTVVEYVEIINAQHYALITGCRWKKRNYFKLIIIKLGFESKRPFYLFHKICSHIIDD
jgi:hypothetical protein